MDKNKYKTKAEAHWVSEEGEAWSLRCSLEDKNFAARLALYSSILRNTKNINSVLEFGAAAGQSLTAMKTLLPNASLHAMEINANVANKLGENLPSCEVMVGSILDIKPPSTYDFVYTSGLLVNIEEEYLPLAYDNIYSSSNRYICVIEYYNPTPVEINYRGKTGILFKRDFAGELLDRYPNLSLVDYGFVYHRDTNFPADDVNWFLLEKTV